MPDDQPRTPTDDERTIDLTRTYLLDAAAAVDELAAADPHLVADALRRAGNIVVLRTRGDVRAAIGEALGGDLEDHDVPAIVTDVITSDAWLRHIPAGVADLVTWGITRAVEQALRDHGLTEDG